MTQHYGSWLRHVCLICSTLRILVCKTVICMTLNAEYAKRESHKFHTLLTVLHAGKDLSCPLPAALVNKAVVFRI